LDVDGRWGWKGKDTVAASSENENARVWTRDVDLVKC
jgi:hypothetical protein